MEKKLDEFLKRKLSVDEAGFGEPSLSLIEQARINVAARKELIREEKSFMTRIADLILPKLHTYRPALAALAVVGCIIYFAKAERGATGTSYVDQSVNTFSSTNSSTVLAGLTQYTGSELPVNSSTVLSSIVTVVVR